MALSNGSGRASGPHDLRLVLLGQPGSGKTTTANAILGRHAFEEQETTRGSVQTSDVGERSVTLIDTPGCLMVSSSSDDGPSRDELERCLSMSAPGPHAFLLVVPLGKPLSEGDVRAVEWIKQRLGEEALRMTVVLFTGREKVTSREWDHFLSQQEVQVLIRSCGGGYHTVNSKAEMEPCHLMKLLEKIDTVVERSGGELYATDKFLEARREVKVEEEEVRALEEKEERQWGEMRREMEMKRQKREEERMKEEEDRKRREEERKKKELLELQEKERRRQRQEREREKRRMEEEKNRQQQERRRLQEEERLQEETRKRLEEEKRQQEEIARRLEAERGRQEVETQRLVEERRRIEAEQLREECVRPRQERNQQMERGGENDGWWRTAERCAAVAGSFIGPLFFRR